MQPLTPVALDGSTSSVMIINQQNVSLKKMKPGYRPVLFICAGYMGTFAFTISKERV